MLRCLHIYFMLQTLQQCFIYVFTTCISSAETDISRHAYAYTLPYFTSPEHVSHFVHSFQYFHIASAPITAAHQFVLGNDGIPCSFFSASLWGSPLKAALQRLGA